jgi:PAS domain S-box-containing protein
MTDKKKRPESVVSSRIPRQELRDKAETQLGKKVGFISENIAALTTKEIQQMLHELRVHQIELEMQNEELRQSHITLDNARVRYFDLYDMAPIGYLTLSEQSLILQANLTASSMLGIARTALIKQPISRIILWEDRDIFYLNRKRLLESGKAQSFELRTVKNDGSQFWASLVITVTYDANGIPELRVVLGDISERKQAETKLNELKLTAEKASLAKSEFLASMSHELRTPLNAILGFAQLIESDTPPPTLIQKRNINYILNAGYYLLELINEILDLAMIESGKLSLSMMRVSLAEVFHECEAMLESIAKKRGIVMKFPHLDTPYFVIADRIRLKQVLLNLLSNAIKYNKLNGMVVVVCTEINPGCVRISVEDTGDGLTAENLTQLFQPFNRLGKEASLEKGTGIGLVASKRIVELMKGSIGVESTVGQGSVFWVELNLTEELQPHLADEPQVVAHVVNADTTTLAPVQYDAKIYTVLYVEDNPANLMLVENIIARRPDINLLSAIDGEQGIETARKSLPDAILMDINLPGISGVEALKILTKEPLTAHIPVIALSANAIPMDIEKCMEAGFISYLIKPIKINELMDVLDAVLKSE